MSNYHVRHFREDDFLELVKLEQETFPLDAYTPEMLRERISKYTEGFWIALRDDKIIGYIAAWIINRQARIDTMAVAAEHRNKGIGSLLLRTALEHFTEKGYYNVELEVRPSNTAAIQLYKKFGFKVVGLKPRYYKADNSDALLMRRLVNGQA